MNKFNSWYIVYIARWHFVIFEVGRWEGCDNLRVPSAVARVPVTVALASNNNVLSTKNALTDGKPPY